MNRKKILPLLLVFCVIFALCACENGAAGEGTSKAAEATYTVKVVDEQGNPMPDVMVQLCKESCFPAVTDAAGVAQFCVPEDAYKASVISVPEGYQADAEEFYFEGDATELTITLRPAA